MAFKMKGPSLYSSSPLKKDKLQRVERGLKNKEDTTADGKMTLKKTRNEKITEAYPGPKREKKKHLKRLIFLLIQKLLKLKFLIAMRL